MFRAFSIGGTGVAYAAGARALPPQVVITNPPDAAAENTRNSRRLKSRVVIGFIPSYLFLRYSCLSWKNQADVGRPTHIDEAAERHLRIRAVEPQVLPPDNDILAVFQTHPVFRLFAEKRPRHHPAAPDIKREWWR